jgi:hypothetical protein
MAKRASRSRRITLSSNWDLSERLRRPSSFPSDDHIDTNDMLLKQRIVFLGSQVCLFFSEKNLLLLGFDGIIEHVNCDEFC